MTPPADGPRLAPPTGELTLALPTGELRLAYLVSQHPALSHSFIVRELAALRAAGAEIGTFSVRPPGPGDVAGSANAAEAARTTVLRDGRWGVWLRAHLSLLLRHPVAYTTTLLRGIPAGPAGARARVWQAMYWVQAVVLLHHLRQRGLRHVHVHFSNNGVDIARRAAAIAAATGETVTWSQTVHGPPEFLDPDSLDVRAKLAQATFVACITDWCQAQVKRLAPSARTVVVHMGVELDRFPVVDRGDHDGPLRVLFVGRLVPEKGPADLVAAVAGLRDVELVVAGDGPLRTDLERRSGPTVRLLGGVPQDDLPDWYAWADVLVLPSYAEGLPVVLMEALATGLPVISTPVAGIPELVVDGETGLLVEPGDVEGIGAAIEKLRDPGLRERLAEVGRARVVADFDSTTTVRPLLAAFAALPTTRRASHAGGASLRTPTAGGGSLPPERAGNDRPPTSGGGRR